MKKINLFLVTLTVTVLLVSCDSDPCDDGYTQLDNGVCIPDYVAGSIQSFEFGDEFYHVQFGVITFKDGKWFDSNNSIIKNIND